MAKELFDGIYSSHRLVFTEKVEKNLRIYLKDMIKDIKIIGSEILCAVDQDDVDDIVRELKVNPELQIEVLNSVNLYMSKKSPCVLVNLSSITNNYHILLKIFLDIDNDEDILKGYERLLSQIKPFFNSADFYSFKNLYAKAHYDAIISGHKIDGMDCFTTYINTEDEIIKEVHFDTRSSNIVKHDFSKNMKIFDLVSTISRFDYTAGIFPEVCLCLALEEIIQLKTPKRVQYIRMMICELFRISSHLYFLMKINKILGNELAFNLAAMERERVLRIIELMTGSRVNPNFIRIGGIKSDLNYEKIKNISDTLPILFKKLNKLEAMMLDNSVITERLKSTGAADKNSIIECGVTGPNLRVAGSRYDLRKNRNLLLYKDISFLVPAGKFGDCLDRVQTRFIEVFQSMLIIDQLASSLPEEHIKKLMNIEDIDLPFTEMISSVECPHGVFKIFIEAQANRISNCIIMGPSKNNLSLAGKVLPGNRFEDLELILASFDISCGELLQG